MITYGCAVFDKAADVFMPMVFVRARGEAIRSFTDAMNDPNHQFAKNWEDFSLYLLCEYDDNLGLVTGRKEPEKLLSGFGVAKVSKSG